MDFFLTKLNKLGINLITPKYQITNGDYYLILNTQKGEQFCKCVKVEKI